MPHRHLPHLHGRRATGKDRQKLGHSIKVETQGAMGIENKLSQEDIDAAQTAIFATDIAVEEAERFANIRKIEVPVQAALKNPEAIFAKAKPA